MIFIGNDIVEVSRIHRIFESYQNHFLNKIFSDKEISVIKEKNKNSIYLSGKFAAKEASKKALMSSGVIKNIPFKTIQVLNHKNGEPYIDLAGSISKDIKNFKVSISHTNTYSTAIAILEI